jgi:hypothetical protein
MKFRNIIRMNMILAAFGAAMFFTSSAYAQQDMDPATFGDGPYVQPMPQPAPGTSTATTSPAQVSVGKIQTADLNAASPSQVESAAVWTPVDTLALTALLTCAVCILLYELDRTRRQSLDASVKRTAHQARGVPMW